MRFCSAFTVELRSSPENQPEISASLCFLRIGPSTVGSIGNLTPVSVPVKPAFRSALRQVSSEVSPPSSSMSLFDQAIGATPSLMGPGTMVVPLLVETGNGQKPAG